MKDSGDEVDITEGSGLGFPKPLRPLVVDGKVYVVEYAMDASGTFPAQLALDELKEGLLASDPDHSEGDPWPDELQPHDWAKVMSIIKYVADRGVPPHGRAVNDLDDGIWEFKHGAKRVSFFDTPGDGTFTPKLRVVDRSASENNDAFWWFPDFDDLLRLGHFFVKTGERADPPDVEMCIQVREEDLSHDA